MTEQMSLFAAPSDGELMELVRLMRRCIDVSPLVPPALRDEVKRRMNELGIEVGE